MHGFTSHSASIADQTYQNAKLETARICPINCFKHTTNLPNLKYISCIIIDKV